MEPPQPQSLLSTLIQELKNDHDAVAGSLGESTTSLLAYMERLERRIARLEENENREALSEEPGAS